MADHPLRVFEPVSQYSLPHFKKVSDGEILILLPSLPGHTNVSYSMTKSPLLCKSLRSRCNVYDRSHERLSTMQPVS